MQKQREILLKRPVSSHPDDKHLSYVLAKWGNEYVTWMYNSEFDSYNYGHYFHESDLEKATEDYYNR